jgi:hypothetical protein
MTTLTNSCSASSSSQATVSAPVIGDDYVLIKRSQLTTGNDGKISPEEKKKIQQFAIGIGKNSLTNGGGRFGACKALLTYDFSFTPSTSSTVQTVIALAPNQDTAFTSHWRSLFSAMKMEHAEVEFDMTEFINPVGHDFALSPVVVGYKPQASTSTMYYADVSNLKTAKFGAYSTAKPVIRFPVPSNWMIGWTAGQEASVTYTYTPRWATLTDSGSSTMHMGYVHFASQKVMFDTERVVVGRLKMWMSFKGQL